MKSGKARVAVIGTGWWATFAHIPGLQAHEGADLVALCDADPVRLNRAADEYQIDSRYDDVHGMLEAEQLDGVVVATTPATHYDVAKSCLERGLHVMVEKPMVSKSSQARELLQIAERQSREVIVGYPWHFTEHTRQARELVQAGELGDIQFVSSIFASMVIEFYRRNPSAYQPVFSYPVHAPTDPSTADTSFASGGQAQIQITHSSGMMFWVSGLRARRVSAFMNEFDVDVDLVDGISVQFDSGAVGVVGSTGNIGVGDGGQHELRIYGSKAYLIMELINGTAAIHYHDGTERRFGQLPEEGRYPRYATAGNLVDVINGTDFNRSPGEVGLRVVEFLEASYRSAAQGAVVPIERG